MKLASIIFALLLTTACLSPEKKEKLSAKTAPERQISWMPVTIKPEKAKKGDFVQVIGHLNHPTFFSVVKDTCDTNKSFTTIHMHEGIYQVYLLCIKK